MYFSDTSTTKSNARIVSKNRYSSTLNSVFKCATVPELCSNLREFYSKLKPSDMKTYANLSFFKGDIMPMWEDEVNQKVNYESTVFELCFHFVNNFSLLLLLLLLLGWSLHAMSSKI